MIMQGLAIKKYYADSAFLLKRIRGTIEVFEGQSFEKNVNRSLRDDEAKLMSKNSQLQVKWDVKLLRNVMGDSNVQWP